MKKNNKKGFTLVEMLVVIAIIAILVSILVPTVTTATDKAKAATDAANLRSTLALVNIEMLSNGSTSLADAAKKVTAPSSKCFPGAETYVAFDSNGTALCAYFKKDSKYYDVTYFGNRAEGTTGEGVTSISSNSAKVG